MNVVSFGGGTNSTPMIIGMYLHKIPVDLILFADPGAEQPHTYDYIGFFDEWLEKHGLPKITPVHCVDKDGNRLTLEQGHPALTLSWIIMRSHARPARKNAGVALGDGSRDPWNRPAGLLLKPIRITVPHSPGRELQIRWNQRLRLASPLPPGGNPRHLPLPPSAPWGWPPGTGQPYRQPAAPGPLVPLHRRGRQITRGLV